MNRAQCAKVCHHRDHLISHTPLLEGLELDILLDQALAATSNVGDDYFVGGLAPRALELVEVRLRPASRALYAVQDMVPGLRPDLGVVAAIGCLDGALAELIDGVRAVDRALLCLGAGR